MTCNELRSAVTTLGLGERASLAEIKRRHRQLVKLYHPDAGSEESPEKIREINAAYRILLDYLAEYCFSFSEEEFYEQRPEERLRQQFADDPLWGRR